MDGKLVGSTEASGGRLSINQKQAPSYVFTAQLLVFIMAPYLKTL